MAFERKIQFGECLVFMGRGCVETHLIACFGPLFFRPWRFSIRGASFVPNGQPLSKNVDQTSALSILPTRKCRQTSRRHLREVFMINDTCAICCVAVCVLICTSHSHEIEVIMPSPLNIRDIGQDRKAALELEAKATGNSIAEVVREWIDAGIARSRAERERAAWIASAKEGIADESLHLEQNGPSLPRFRQL